ncbi:MAG: hypothetical protein LBG97_02300 [Coriobacteriales bacterium]|jgi:Tfp pilus assembly PilM family ATPase|nr:hypothetical protein [Coriobacteriales bacterium]
MRQSLSIYCSPTELRVLKGTVRAASVSVDSFLSANLPEGSMINGIVTSLDGMSRFLATMNQQFGPFKDDATLIVDNNTIRSKRVVVPSVGSVAMADFVARELESLIEEDANDVIDYTPLGKDEATGGTIALGVVAGREQLDTYVRMVQQAGFNLKRVDVAINALIKVARLFSELQSGIKLLCYIDTNILNLVYYDQGAYLISKKHRLIAAQDTDERRSEISAHISAMLQFQKTQQRERVTEGIFFLGIPEHRVKRFAQSAMHLQTPICALGMPTSVKLQSQAAFTSAEFSVSNYLLNIGCLLRKL